MSTLRESSELVQIDGHGRAGGACLRSERERGD